MIDQTAATLALRARAVSVTIATTTSTSLSATANGYARASGSFLTDGFAVGMEITEVTGFSVTANNQATTARGRMVTGVTALTLTCSGCAVDADASGRTVKAGLPFDRAFDNVPFDPATCTGFPFVEEDFVPATTLLMGAKNGGLVQETGLYVLKLYGMSGTGVSAIRKAIDALKTLYAPGTTLTAGSHTVRVRTDIGPFAGQILPQGDGRSLCVLTVPWEAYSINAIAA